MNLHVCRLRLHDGFVILIPRRNLPSKGIIYPCQPFRENPEVVLDFLLLFFVLNYLTIDLFSFLFQVFDTLRVSRQNGTATFDQLVVVVLHTGPLCCHFGKPLFSFRK